MSTVLCLPSLAFFGDRSKMYLLNVRNGVRPVADKRNDFSVGSISKAILGLALPMTAAQVVNILYSVVDRIYLGRIPDIGHLALAGLGVTMPVISILLAFANLCGMGGAPLCSIHRGKGEHISPNGTCTRRA